MKLGIEFGALDGGYDEIWGEDAIKVFKSHGFSCIDYGLAHTESWEYTVPIEEAEEKLRAFQDKLLDGGVEVSQVHGPWRYPPKDNTKEDRDERLEKMKKSIRLTAALGCKRWVIHPIMPFGIEDIGTGNEEETWKINLEIMRELVKVAHEYDVTICYENMPFPKLSIASPDAIMKFVDEIDDEKFKICLDTGHANIFRDKSLGDVVRAMGDRIEALHVHDNDSTNDYHWLPFFGTIDWPDFGKALKEIGFDGVFSYETSVPWPMTPTAYELMSKGLAQMAKEILLEM